MLEDSELRTIEGNRPVSLCAYIASQQNIFNQCLILKNYMASLLNVQNIFKMQESIIKHQHETEFTILCLQCHNPST